MTWIIVAQAWHKRLPAVKSVLTLNKLWKVTKVSDLQRNILPYLGREASGLFSNHFMEVEEAKYNSV